MTKLKKFWQTPPNLCRQSDLSKIILFRGKYESYQKSFVPTAFVCRFRQGQQAPFTNNWPNHCVCYHAFELLSQKHCLQQRPQRGKHQLLWRLLFRPKWYLEQIAQPSNFAARSNFKQRHILQVSICVTKKRQSIPTVFLFYFSWHTPLVITNCLHSPSSSWGISVAVVSSICKRLSKLSNRFCLS